MFSPKRVKDRVRKSGRARENVPARGSSLAFGDYGLQALEPGWIANQSLEAARIAITRHIKRGGKLWVRVFPNRFVSKQLEGDLGLKKIHRNAMVAIVKPGRILFELEGVPPEVAKRALQLGAAKLPVKCKIIDREAREWAISQRGSTRDKSTSSAPSMHDSASGALSSAAAVPSDASRPDVPEPAPREETAPAATPQQLVAMADYLRARRGFGSDRELAEQLGVHPTRVAAWKRGTGVPNPENLRLLFYLAVVVEELEAFLDPDVIPDWLGTEQYTLGARTPVDALREGRLAEVLYAANATEHGAFV